MSSPFEVPADRVTVVSWQDEPKRRSKPYHDARSLYVERFWLGVIGPSSMALLRHLNNELEISPVGFVMHYEEAASVIGVRGSGKTSPFVRTLHRLCQFEMARMITPTRLAVRQQVPTLSTRFIGRLPEPVQQRHAFFLAQLTTQADALTS